MFKKWSFLCKIYPFNEIEICQICLAPLIKKEKNIIFLHKCKHKYHIECIRKWISYSKTCPYCRSCQKQTKKLLDNKFTNFKNKLNLLLFNKITVN